MTINDDIKQACEVMQRGGIILYPTDTIWGIGCDATNAEAVQRVYKIKQRADSKALIVLTDSEAKVEYYVSEVPETAWQLLDVAVKPLTLIYPGARNLATNLLADDGSIAIRITKEPHNNCADSSEKLSYQPRPISAGMRLPITFPKYRTK